jgi:sugar O-acyltransferase (sialic acid O-acetyltransferase NeuD family)
MIKVTLYGAAGYAVSVREMMVQGLGDNLFAVAAYIDDFRGDVGEMIGDVPVISFAAWQADYIALPCVPAVGEAAARRKLAARVAAAGGSSCAIYRVQGAISPRIIVGTGSFIGYPAYIGAYVEIGQYVNIMPMAIVGHDVSIGDYVTICAGANIAGHVVIEDDVFVGAGAVIVNGSAERKLRVGAGAKIAAGAVVTKSVPPGAVLAGNPARRLRDIAAERRAQRG